MPPNSLSLSQGTEDLVVLSDIWVSGEINMLIMITNNVFLGPVDYISFFCGGEVVFNPVNCPESLAWDRWLYKLYK